MQVNKLSGYFRTIDLTLRYRTLLEFTEVNVPTDGTVYGCPSSDRKEMETGEHAYAGA